MNRQLGTWVLSSDDEQGEGEQERGVSVINRTRPKRPPRYKVLLHNDDYTTMEFVMLVLQKFFSKTVAEAKHIMLKVHQEGVGVCGVYTFEIAETKVNKVSRFAREHGHPLKCTYEKE